MLILQPFFPPLFFISFLFLTFLLPLLPDLSPQIDPKKNVSLALQRLTDRRLAKLAAFSLKR